MSGITCDCELNWNVTGKDFVIPTGFSIVDMDTPRHSSARKSGRKALLMVEADSESSGIPVWISSFAQEWNFRRELEGFEAANRLDVGPDLVGSLVGQVFGSVPETFRYHILQSYAGISLSSLIEGKAAPGFRPDVPGIFLAEVGSGMRYVQAAKIAFDLACDINAIHRSGRYYMDLKPENVAVQACEDNPVGIRAMLIDFESMTNLSDVNPGIGTKCLYRKLEEYICASIPDNHTFDLGCLLLNVASVLSGKPIAELSVADIDTASSMPGMDFFKVVDGVLEVEPISEWHLDDMASACGLKKQECPWNISSSAIATHRNCYFDKIDWMRIERLPEYVLNELQYQLAISFHAIFKKMSNPHLPILPEQAAEDFDSQPEELRRQGFEQALSVQRQLERLKYELVPLGSGRDHMVIPQFPEREIIALARNEHGRWLKLHERQGYIFHELVDGKRLEEDESGKPVKYNEYMLPWKDLVRVDLEGNPIQVEENSVRELKKTRARNDIEWAEYLVRVIGEVAKLGIVKKQTK